jgi:pimeloyl-ACP methyl ester carboxylesterase
MARETVGINGQEIAYLESPGTGRPVIFVHGNSSSADTWQPLLDGPFGAQFRCLALDLPGHGESAPAADPATYSLPGYAKIVAGFATTLDAPSAVFVGWSLGGHVVLEAAPALPEASGFVIFGTPPVAEAAQMAEAFYPNPAMSVGFTAEVSPEDALTYATSFTAPASPLILDGFTADILRTEGTAREALFASVGEGKFTDEIEVVTNLDKPLAIIQGAEEQLVNRDYLERLNIPALWRGQVQIVPNAGHATHQEQSEDFTILLTNFMADLAAN